jgi:hypothetical protein
MASVAGLAQSERGDASSAIAGGRFWISGLLDIPEGHVGVIVDETDEFGVS